MADDKDQRIIEIILKAQDANASLKEMGAGAAVMAAQLGKMGQDDPGRAKLVADLQLLNGRLATGRAEMRDTAQSAEELAAAEAKLAAQQIKVVVDGQKVSATFNEMKAAGAQLEKQLGDLSHDDPGRAKLLADYKALQGRIEDVKNEMGQTVPKANLFKEALGFAGIALTAEAAVEGVIDLGKSVFEATSKFEKYEAVMTNALGDKSKAQQAMKDIQLMAAKTPFSVDELTGSFIKFVNRGLQPSMAEMTKMADLAASQGKSFDQLTEAVLDAAGGEFERLKEFGLKASKSGDQVSLSFKGVNQVVANTPEAIQGAILAFGGMQGVAGSTAAISKTLDGQLSNLGDTADMLETKVGKGLSPVFTLLLTLFSNFLGWIGRFVDAAAPLKSMFTEIGDVIMDYYHSIGDILESLGLFSEKTDTVKWAVEALKVALMLLLIPFKVSAQVMKGVIDLFIDWYNKSELLRGVLGGLGAVVVGLFVSIKDNALKILGGVGDILVGIFTLDKNKIVNGFKNALNATADVMLAGGERAAEQFKKGFEANKNNHITRTVRVKTETEDGPSAPAGEKLTSDNSLGDAAAEKKRLAAEKKAKADRDRADRERLSDLKKWVKDEGDILDTRNLLEQQRQQEASTVEQQHRQAQRQKILDDADKKYQALAVLEGNHTLEMQAVLEERDQKLRELQQGFDEKDEQKRKQKLDEQLKDIEAQAQEEAARLENQHANRELSEQEYEDRLYALKKQALDEQLKLLTTAGKAETDAAKKVQTQQLQNETDHVKKSNALKQNQHDFELKMGAATAGLLKDGLQLVEDNLSKQSEYYELAKVARKAAAIAEIGINLAMELSYNAVNAAKLGPVLGIPALTLANGLSIGRAVLATIKVAAFKDGGSTAGGTMVPMSPWADVVSGASGGSFAGGGPINKATLGLIGEAGPELVVPNWLYADPKQANLMGFLEAQIASRGHAFADGGSTTGASPVVATEPGAELGQLVGLMQQLVQGQQEFRDEITEWQRDLNVNLDPRKAKKAIDVTTQVMSGGGLR